ncbi:DUF2933 domain-containing protein [Desertibaculum subflavum]|uniref:DUF2933 domain-containing protein n=1 Tax=Desertibaculum subflavum TaxID=2268458 RepID=UPI000E6728DE
MDEHKRDLRDGARDGGILRSRAGIVLIAFLVIAGTLLTYEHRVHLFTGNGLLVVLLAACIGMHLFMHGGHGGHGSGGAGGGGRQ